MRSPCLLLRLSALIALTIAVSFVAHAQAPGYPAFIVDAQVPVYTYFLRGPTGLAVAPGGTVYTADSGNSRVLQTSPAGFETIVSFGNLKPALGTPGGVALDSTGNLYVTDTANNRVIKLPAGSPNGLTIITGLNKPTAIAVDTSGNLAILNSGNNTIIERRGGGTAALFNTGSTTLIMPTALNFNISGSLYVADQGNAGTSAALYLFPKLGGTATSISSHGFPLTGISGIASDPAGNVFLTLAPSGFYNFLLELPVGGTVPLTIPTATRYIQLTAIALDSLGNIYFADANVNAVAKLYFNNAANFGAISVGKSTAAIVVNFAFYQTTTLQTTLAFGGGISGQDYYSGSAAPYPVDACVSGSGNPYSPQSQTGYISPATCSLAYYFQPTMVGGRPGALRLKTSIGSAEQLFTGVGQGAQIALLNAAVTAKLTQYYPQSLIGDASNTYLYFSNGTGTASVAVGTYKVPTSSNTATLLSSKIGLLSVNGAGDLFIFDGTAITKIPSDGTAATTISVPKAASGGAFAMDYNGAFFFSPANSTGTPYLIRLGAGGVVTDISAPAPSHAIQYLTSDLEGNLYESGFDIAQIETGTGTYKYTQYYGMNGGSGGESPVNIGVDESQTLYYYNDGDTTNGLQYLTDTAQQTGVAQLPPPPPGVCDGIACTLPLYTSPGVSAPSNNGPYVPLIPKTGNQQIATTPNGKMYFINSQSIGDNQPAGILLVDRTQGAVLPQAFQSGFQGFGGPTQELSVYNIGNQPLVFQSGSSTYTQTGNTSAYIFTTPSSYPACESGTTVAPTQYCAIQVTDNNKSAAPPAVDTLHFLTNAINNSTVSFKITGPPAP